MIKNPYDEVREEIAEMLYGLAEFTQERFETEDKHSEDFVKGYKSATMIVILGFEKYLGKLENRSQTWEEASKSRTETN